jgi:hypothetical protein
MSTLLKSSLVTFLWYPYNCKIFWKMVIWMVRREILLTPTSGDYLTLRCSLQLTWYCRHVQNYRMLSYKRELFSNDILTPRFFDIKTGQGQWTQIVHEIFYASYILLYYVYLFIVYNGILYLHSWDNACVLQHV